MLSNLTFDEYQSWCLNRFPDRQVSEDDVYAVEAATVRPEPCPVTVRSVESRAVITPRGSR